MCKKKIIKVAFLDYSHIFAGAERVLYTIISNLDREKVEPVIVFPYPQKHQDRYADLDCEKYWLSSGKRWWMGSERWQSPLPGTDTVARTIWGLKLARLLQKINADVLHVNLLRPDDLMWLLPTSLTRTKIVGHFRSQAIEWIPPKSVQRLCDKVLCVSQYSRSRFLTKGEFCDSAVLYDSVDATRFNADIPKNEALRSLGFEPDTLLISSVGQLSRHKGHDNAIRAFAEISKAYPEARLFIAGKGVAYQELQDLVKSFPHIQDKVRFSGEQVSDVSTVYRASALTLSLTKVGEAFGLVPYESALHGTPFIAPEVGAVREFVVDGENGLLVDTNDVKKIAEKITWVLDNPDQAGAMAAEAKKLVFNRLSPKEMTRNLQQVYEQLCNDR